MSKPLRPNRFYSHPELEQELGRTLANQCTPLAAIRGKYWGATIIAYMDELGRRSIANMLDSTVDSKPVRKHSRSHVTKKRSNTRPNYNQDTEP